MQYGEDEEPKEVGTFAMLIILKYPDGMLMF